MNMIHYPKVLLLCSLSQSTANGITIANLFKGWPKDRIALAEFNDAIEDIYVPGIELYYIIGAKESRFIWPFRYLKKMRPSKVFRLTSAPEKRGQAGIRSTGPASRVKSFIAGLQSGFLHKSGLAMVSRTFKISAEFESFLQEFDPDFIYCSGGDICKLEFLLDLKNKFGPAAGIHIFDDYINSKHEGTWFPRYWRRRLTATFRKVVDGCDLHLAIGDKMAAEYTEKYGKRFHGFHNPIDPDIWLRQTDTEERAEEREGATAVSRLSEPNPVFRFLYAGKINKDTVGPLKLFAKTAAKLRQSGHEISLGIHSPYPLEEIQRLLGSCADDVYLGKIPYEDLPGAFRNANALLLPLDFTDATIRYIRLSMLTKATEYMISGTPIFCFAPADIAVTEYLRAHDAAICCTEPDKLEQAVLNFVADNDGRARTSGNAVRRAEAHHMMAAVNERLQGLILAATQS